MSILVACSQCGKQYNVGEGLLGKRLKCAGCGTAFVVQAAVGEEAADPLLADPASPDAADSRQTPGLGNPYPSSKPGRPQTRLHPADGPTDRQFRIGAAVCISLVILGMLLAFFALRDLTIGARTLVAIGPFVVFFGIAALVDPDIARAATKFGGHLPRRYKRIVRAVGLAALACSLTLAFLILSQ